jgi:uncharacterized protein (TIGR00255 family)
MTLSMTGFARREARNPLGAFAWEVRAVNHRYLEPSLRLPEDFRALEPELREAIAARLNRGKVDATLRHEPAHGVGALAVDEALAREVYQAAERLSAATGARLDERSKPTAMELLRWPGVVVAATPDPAPLHAVARELLKLTLDELVANRAREGAKLASAIAERAQALGRIVARQRARVPELKGALRARLATRLAELGASVEPSRFEQEVALIVAKGDVAEELDRLDAHLGELDRVLGLAEPVGRKLDFLMQEFNREANTFGSKSQDPVTTRASVEMKVLIEQMREQVQNIE